MTLHEELTELIGCIQSLDCTECKYLAAAAMEIMEKHGWQYVRPLDKEKRDAAISAMWHRAEKK